MNEQSHVIGLLFANRLDRELIAEFLQSSGYGVHAASFSKENMDEWARVSLIIADETAARSVGKLLLALKRQSSAALLPILVALPQNAEAVVWLRAGFDDVLRLPVAKGELVARLRTFLRLREHSLEQRRADQALLEEVLRQMPAAVIIAEAPSGRLILGNQHVEEVWGVPMLPSTRVGEYGMWRGFHPGGEMLSAEEWPLARSLTKGEVVTGEEIEIERADGTRRIIWVSSAPVYGRDERIIAGVVTFYDITERKQAELVREQLLENEHKAREEAEAANRAKDDFLSILSHELRTPLTPIIGWVSMLRGGLLQNSPESLDQALATIERNARQELTIVDEMLDLSRILNNKVVLEPEPLNPVDALAASFTSARALIENRKLQLESNIEQDLPLIYADSKRLQQILSNLISNAVKFTPDGGTIKLGVRRAGASGVEFFVCDTGVGIRPEALSSIFDRFSQADTSITRRYGGLGIGLSVVRGLVELHGGRVRAESDGDGCGATFVVTFPVMARPSETTESRAGGRHSGELVRRANTTGRERVLVVDDSPDTLAILKVMIESGGYEVEVAESTDRALEVARSTRPDVIVTDIGMPDQGGFELLKRVRADDALACVPLIALTGFASSSDRETALRAGFSAHLAKPVEQPALVHAIDEALNAGSQQSPT
ncbi:MAG TPA: response regulator [Pyrinomonadaceae bacterium]|nr:response regulator [Pyrinomonadaceae bacterium]